MYFITITMANKAKNGLEKQIHKHMKAWDQRLILDRHLEKWLIQRDNDVELANIDFPRCAPQELRKWKTDDDNIGIAPCESMIMIVYKVRK